MRTTILFLVGLVSLTSCNEYDLNREEKETNPTETIDTGEYVPTEDPDIMVTPESLDFSYIRKNCTSDPETITIKNKGLGTLIVDTIDFSGSGSSVFNTTATPPTLEHDEEYTFEVTFTPTAWVTYDQASISIVSNDPDESPYKVPLAGIGAEDPIYEETFTQGTPGPVDVLWVVDNSGSMGEEIQMVKDNFDVFFGQFIALGLDFHLGAVTTDMNLAVDSGRLKGSPTYIDTSTPNPDVSFANTIDGIYQSTGSGSERGFDAVKAALTDPLLTGYNSGFFRDVDIHGNEVSIYTIVVTDENDDSSMSASAFSSWYSSLKTDPDNALFSAICGDPVSAANPLGGCQEWIGMDMLSAESGGKYVDAANATGGLWSSICTTDFTEALQYLSLSAMGLYAEFALRYEPTSVADMTVKVNGTQITYSGVDGWTYESASNSVFFHGEEIPPPSATIEISYPYNDGSCN